MRCRSVLDHLRHKPLAVAIAVGERGIDEVQAEFACSPQGDKGFIVGAAFPLFAANTPGAVADLANLKTSPAKSAVFHQFHGTCPTEATHEPESESN